MLSRMLVTVVVAASSSLWACGAGSPLAELPEGLPEAARKTDQNHLLLFPVADAESLLGRAVRLTEDGAWTIADTRAPGCDVKTTRKPAEYSVKRRVDLRSLTAVSAGFAQVVGFEARYGAQDKVDIDIQNAEILSADTRGPCGEVIVDQVFVGRGKRSLAQTREAGGEVTGAIGAITPGAAHDAKSELADTLAWSEDQAYGFTYKQLAEQKPLSVRAKLPSLLTEGDPVELRFETDRAAWLVVYYIEQVGPGAVLWPSAEEPEPKAAPGSPAVLPSAAERSRGIALEATLRKPGQPAIETLVVYAFSEKGDFDRVKPPAGETSNDGAALAAGLTQKVEQLPLSRWARAIVQYEIRPKP